MLRRALVVGIAGWLCAQEPVPTPPAPAPAPAAAPVAAPTPRAQAEQFVRQLADPDKQSAAVEGLVALGDAAIPALHKALLDRRSDVLQWALFACSGLHGDCASLRTPVERLLASQDLGVALMARRAWHAVEGRNGVLLTLNNGNVVLVTDTNEKVLLKLPDAFHTELLPNGNLLTVSQTLGSVREVRMDGQEVWAQGDLRQLVDCQRLPDGNTLVCNFTGRTVVELKPDGSVAWSLETTGNPFAVDRLANGNTLIIEFNQGGVIEVDRNGRTVWSFASPHLSSARRQLDGTTLVTDRQMDRIRLVGPDGKVQRTWKCDGVLRAELLPNGHLVVNRRDTVLVLDDRALPLWVTERKEILGMQVLGAGPFRANATPAEPEPQKK